MMKRFFLMYLTCAYLLVLTGFSSTTAQTLYRAGMAEASLEPGHSTFSIALSGYGFPRGGRFSLLWKESALPASIFKSKALSKKWKIVTDQKHFPDGMRAVVEYKNRLLALTDQNELYRLDLSAPSAEWIKMAALNQLSYKVQMRSIEIYKDQLYGLGEDKKVYEAAHQTEGDLSVRAVAISDQSNTAVLIGADLCGFNIDFINSIKTTLYKKHGLRPEGILINASHTHFAPSTQDWTAWGSHQLPDTLYLNEIVRPAMLKAVASALKDQKPAALQFGRGKTAIGKNRSLRGADIPYDDDVDVLQIMPLKGGNSKIVFLAGCHPVFKNEGLEGFTLSANYPGAARRALEQNGKLNTMFLQGCAGDINPVSLDHEETGRQLATDVSKVLSQELEKLDGVINFHMDSVAFPVDAWSKEKIEAFRQENDKNTQDVNLEKNVRWADLMLKLYRERKMPTQMPVYIQTINIGNWKLVGLSREVTTSYSLGIKALWPEKRVSVAGYCNDVSSYLPTSRHIQAGTYEGSNSFFWYGQPHPFPIDVYEKIMAHIKAKSY